MTRYNIRVLGQQTSFETEESIGKSLGRRLNATPDTRVDSGGSIGSYTFDGQEIDHGELREIRDVRESGGLIAQLVHAKALMYFGTGVEFHVEDDDDNGEPVEVIDGETVTLTEYLEDTFNDINTTALDIGEDSVWYPYGACEITETRGGDFGGIVGVEPWTIVPATNAKGEIVAWEQETKSNGTTNTQTFAPEDIKHFIVNKRSARDEIGVSAVKRSEEEITQFKENQRAMRNAIEMHGFPEWHVKAGREGGSPMDDQELRRIIQLFEDRRSNGDTVTATGPDVELDRMDPGEIALEEVTSNDLQQVALALGVPIDAVDFGSEGLGSGEQSKLRRMILELDILATQRTYMNQWVTKIIRPVLRDYTPFDHTVNLEMRLEDPLTGMEDMAELINTIGPYMETNEARQKLDLPPRDDLEGEYGQPDAAGEDGDGGIFDQLAEDKVDTALQERGLGGEPDVSHYEDWERSLQEMHQRLWDADAETRLLNIPTSSATPEFVKERIRDTLMAGALFSDFETIGSSERMELREYMTETLTADGWTVDGLSDQLMQLDGIDSRDDAEVIARTETASVLNQSRLEGYEETGQVDDSTFYWSGNIDGRTTEACAWLIRQTNPNQGGEPVTLERLKELIEEAPSHDPDMDDDLARPDDFVIHPNERKTFIRAPP